MTTTDTHRLLQTFVHNWAHYLGFLRVLCRREDEAEELFQELAVEVMENIARFNPERGDFDAWVRGVARNLYREACKRRGRRQTVEPELAAAIAGAYDAEGRRDSERREATLVYLRQCLEQLPARHRRLIRARYEHGRSSAEVASLLGKTVNAIDSAICRLRASLVACVRRRLEGAS